MIRCSQSPAGKSGEPFLHRLQDFDQFFLPDHIGDHCIHIIQERAAEHAVFISKLLISPDSVRIIYFYAYAGAHDPDLLNVRVGETFHFTPGDLFDPADLRHIVLFFK